MNNYFLLSFLNNKPTVTVFILCLYLLQVQATASTDKNDTNLMAVLSDLKQIKSCSKIDASLYTAEMTNNECKASVMSCFILELDVIYYESKYGSDKKFSNVVHNVLKNIRSVTVKNQSNKTSTCQKCETFGEKKCTEFIQRFEDFVKQFYAELKGKKQS